MTDVAIGSAVVVTRMVKSVSSMYVWLCMCVYVCLYSENSLIRHSMGPENNVGLGGC